MYTISTLQFDTIEEAQEQIQEWLHEGILDLKSKVFKVEEVYEPVMVLRKVRKDI